MADTEGSNPLRTGIFGVVIVTCLVLVSFGYSGLPFLPQGKKYEAYFTDAGGITPGNDVSVSGITVGKVTGVALAGDSARVDFTVARDVRVGDQSLVAIRTDTVLGEKSLAVTPKGAGSVTSIPLGRTTTPYTLNTALQDLGQNASELDKPRFEQALQTITDSLAAATPYLRSTLDGVADLSRSLNKRDAALDQLLAHAKRVSDTLAQRAGQVNELIVDGNLLFAALDERRQALSNLIAGIDDV
ncbi:MAG: MCE family protein, partial [Actinomycetota bacterium]|nr:MCE family protein [Actinomycetota bacterium]